MICHTGERGLLSVVEVKSTGTRFRNEMGHPMVNAFVQNEHQFMHLKSGGIPCPPYDVQLANAASTVGGGGTRLRRHPAPPPFMGMSVGGCFHCLGGHGAESCVK